jgi:hypothetical protein
MRDEVLHPSSFIPHNMVRRKIYAAIEAFAPSLFGGRW